MEEHIFTEGEKKCLKEYWENCSRMPRKNLIKLVRHINMLNPMPSEKSWEYIFFDRQLTDVEVDALLQMKLRHPYYIKDLARVLKSSVEKTAKFADKMVHIGILEYTSDDQGIDLVQMPVFAPGAMENSMENGQVSGNGTCVFKLYLRSSEKDCPGCADGVCTHAGDSGGGSHKG